MNTRSIFYDPAARFVAIPGNLAQAAHSTTDTDTSAAFDRTILGADGKQISAVIVTGQLGATTGTPTGISVTIQVQDSADGSTGWASVGSALTLTAASDNACHSVDLANADRYIRVLMTVTLTGGTTPTVFASSQMLGIYEKSTS